MSNAAAELSDLMDRYPNLAACEAVIERGLAVFVGVGMALVTVRDRGLYKQAGYATFEDYCTKRWNLSRSRAYELMDASEVVRELSEISDTPLPVTDSQARELKGLPPETAAEVMNHAAANGKLTARTIAEAREQISPKEPQRSESKPEVLDPFAGWSEDEHLLRRQLESGFTVVVSLRPHHERLIKWAEERGLFARIDRRSDWGNPFEIPDDGTRDVVIAKYAEHYLPHKNSLLARLPDLRGKALGCWCAPERCHGDVLKAWAER